MVDFGNYFHSIWYFEKLFCNIFCQMGDFPNPTTDHRPPTSHNKKITTYYTNNNTNNNTNNTNNNTNNTNNNTNNCFLKLVIFPPTLTRVPCTMYDVRRAPLMMMMMMTRIPCFFPHKFPNSRALVVL